MQNEVDIHELMSTIIIHSLDVPSAIGLLHGQMGIILTIEEYSHKFERPWLSECSDFIFDNICQRIPRNIDNSFAYGLSGIGWGLEYLIQKGYMDGVGDELCKDIDKVISQIKISRITDLSIETGLLGLWEYVSARIQGNIKCGRPMPFDEEFLTDWVSIIELHPQIFDSKTSISTLDRINVKFPLTPLDITKYIHTHNNPKHTPNLSLVDGLCGMAYAYF